MFRLESAVHHQYERIAVVRGDESPGFRRELRPREIFGARDRVYRESIEIHRGDRHRDEAAIGMRMHDGTHDGAWLDCGPLRESRVPERHPVAVAGRGALFGWWSKVLRRK